MFLNCKALNIQVVVTLLQAGQGGSRFQCLDLVSFFSICCISKFSIICFSICCISEFSIIPGGAFCFIARLTLGAVSLAAFSLVFRLENLQ